MTAVPRESGTGPPPVGSRCGTGGRARARRFAARFDLPAGEGVLVIEPGSPCPA